MLSIIRFLAVLPAVFAAPFVHEVRQGVETIANSWIVRIKNDAILADVLSQITQAAGVQPKYTYNIGNFKGFSIDNVADATNLLANIASIASIEPNTKVTASALVTQVKSTYGLARISHRQKGSDRYLYDSSAGRGTFSYIIDTGIYTQHRDFGGRAIKGANFIDGESDADGNGHGTHVAGTTGSSTYGVAKRTTLIAVKVLSAAGSGSNAGVLAGIDWAVNDMKTKGRVGKSVANLSLGGAFSPMSNAAAAEAVNQGLFLAVAAGNSGAPVITASPASAPEVCTVGATDKDDNRASFSNFGAGVDIFAAGVDVKSTWIRSNTDTNTISGTSMATPHITGLGAYLLALEGPRTPAALCDRIKALSTKNAILLPLSPNNLAYNGNGA